MLFLRNRTLSFSDPAETSNANGDGSGRRRSAEAAAAAATTTAAAAAAAAAADASAPPQRSRRPFGRVASWVQEVPAEPSSKSESGKPPLAPPPPTANKPSSSSTSTSAPPPSRLLPLPSLPWWQRLVFKGLVATRAAATNDKVLIMRTLTQEVAVPGAPCNGDYLAKRFREARCSSVGRDVSLKLLSAVGLRKSYWKSYASVVDRLLPGNYRYLDARVRFFDGAVKEAVGACCGCSQVVALAAGFDSRGTRFLADPNGEDPDASSSSDSSPLSKKPAPLLRIFEVDLPEVVAGKRKLLADLLPDEEKWPRPELVAADLSDAAKACETLLSAPGFDRRARTLFTAEGLFMYLPREKTRALIRELGKICGKGSLLAFDYLDADSTGVSSHEEIEAKEVPAPPGRGVFATLGHMVTGLGEPYLDAFPSGAEEQSKEVAEGTGWKVKEVLDPSEIGRRFFPGSEEEIQKAKVPVVSRTNGLATWEKT